MLPILLLAFLLVTVLAIFYFFSFLKFLFICLFLFWTSGFQNCEEIHFLLLKPSRLFCYDSHSKAIQLLPSFQILYLDMSMPPKNWWFWIVVLEKTVENPLNYKEIKPVHPKGNQSWIFIGRTDAEAEAPILWPPDAKSWLIGKDSDAGKAWRQEKGAAENEIVR